MGCRTAPEQATGPDYQSEISGTFNSVAIVSPHPLSSRVGEEVLRRGGNAVDASVAIQFAMAVVYPRAGNLGGGGFFVYRAADGAVAAIDYREQAPAAADKDMYLDENGEVQSDKSTRGHLAVGVPGTVAGLAAQHADFGSLPWADLVQPAIDLAREGFLLSQSEAERLAGFQDDFNAFNTTSPFLNQNWTAGARLTQPELAATLERIRDQGKDGFYTGETARLIAAEMQSGGGLITEADLAEYTVKRRTPITVGYGNYRLISMPPSSSGGVALGQLLQLTNDYPLAEMGFQSTAATHLMVEAERRVYADRAAYLGDSDFYEVPTDSLLSLAYLRERMTTFLPDSATTSDRIGSGEKVRLLESYETTHISIVDSLGNAVSVTTTLNGNFGSKVIVDGAGFFLNNEMDDFSAKPGVPNMFGLVGAEANAIAPGKRMLSSMTPTILEKDGKLHLVLGAPGGSTIITAVYQVILNSTVFGMPLDSAVRAPRFHHQWLPDVILHEPEALDTLVRKDLWARGHTLREVGRMAVVKAIQVQPDGSLFAVGDARNPDDDVAGF